MPGVISATFTKTLSEPTIDFFAGITGDFDPVHTDVEWCREHGLDGTLVHGALIVALMSTASTKALAGSGRLVLSVGYDRLRFVRPVHVGDTVTVRFSMPAPGSGRQRQIAEVTAHNQHDEIVAVAQHVLELLD